MVQQWNFGIQRQLPKDYLVEGSHISPILATGLAATNTNWNQIPLVNGRGPARQSQQLRLFPTFNGVASARPTGATPPTTSGNLKIEKRYSGGFNMLANYTWAKYLDDVEAGSELSEFQGQPRAASRAAASRPRLFRQRHSPSSSPERGL